MNTIRWKLFLTALKPLNDPQPVEVSYSEGSSMVSLTYLVLRLGQGQLQGLFMWFGHQSAQLPQGSQISYTVVKCFKHKHPCWQDESCNDQASQHHLRHT